MNHRKFLKMGISLLISVLSIGILSACNDADTFKPEEVANHLKDTYNAGLDFPYYETADYGEYRFAGYLANDDQIGGTLLQKNGEGKYQILESKLEEDDISAIQFARVEDSDGIEKLLFFIVDNNSGAELFIVTNHATSKVEFKKALNKQKPKVYIFEMDSLESFECDFLNSEGESVGS